VTLWLGAVSCFLMAKSYVIVWMILWVAAISLFLMAVVDGLDGYAEPSQWDLSVALAPSTEPRNGPPLRGPEDACIHVALAPSTEPRRWVVSTASWPRRCGPEDVAPKMFVSMFP
jgi:hypothetical protein